MWLKLRLFFLTFAMVSLSTLAYGENWIEFHTEKWSKKSGKSGKKLNFSSSYYYDADTVARAPSGDLTLWVKETDSNDKYYVKKGEPQSESLFRQIRFWCRLKRYEVIQADTDDGGANELMSEEIKSGSYYESLYKTVCERK